MNIKKLVNGVSYGFKTFGLRKKLPYLLGIVITDKCNLNCFYCESKNSGRYHFSYADAKQAIFDAYKRGHRALYFTGGEPMIWEDNGIGLETLIEYARELGFFDVFVFTNGTMPLNISECSYIVTIDGPKEIHNKIRGGTYDLVIENVRNAVSKAVFASITFSKANLNCMADYIREMRALGIFKGISFNLLTHCPEIVEKHGISANEKEQLLDGIWELKTIGYPIVLSRAAYLALRNNKWKRPIPQIELCTNEKIFTCCRDVGNPAICDNCGYVNCVEVSQILALKPSAIRQALRMLS